MASRRKNPESESKTSTRKSARLNNINSNRLKMKTGPEREKITKKDNLKICPVLTRSRARLFNCVGSSDGSTVTDVHTAENYTGDLDGSIVRTLTFSDSSDNNCNVSNKIKSSKVLKNNENKIKLMDQKRIDGEQHVDEESANNAMGDVTHRKSYNLRKRTHPATETGNGTADSATMRHVRNKKSSHSRGSSQNVENDNEATNNTVLKSVTNRASFDLPVRRSPRFTGNGNKTEKVSKEKISTRKAQETKEKGKRNEKNKQPSSVDMHKPKLQPLKKFNCTSSLSCHQEKDAKKPKVRKKGTLARKRELRAMLEKQDEGYEDDAFEGTPFRNRRPALKCKLSPVVLDASIQSISTDTDCTTSCSMTPANRLRPVGPYSSETSENDVFTPGLLSSFNRNDIDCYVNQLKRRKFHLGCNRKIKSHTPLSKKPCKVIHSKLWDISGDSKCRQTTTDSENCENTEDYYWSDIE